MRNFPILFLLAIALGHVAFAGAQGSTDSSSVEEDEWITVGPIIEDSVQIAFYVSAARSLAKSMRKAAKKACVAADGKIVRNYDGNHPERSLDWLCDGSPVRFFMGVGIEGEKLKYGFICSAEEGNVGFKYNMGHMFAQARDCVGVGPNSETGRLEINVYHDAALCLCSTVMDMETGSIPTAFYVSAPRSLARSMHTASNEACAAAGGKLVRSYGQNLPELRLDWLCGGSRLRFFSGVAIDGAEMKHGFICSAEESSVGFKYTMPNMFGYARDCVAVGENPETGELRIDVQKRSDHCPCN